MDSPLQVNHLKAGYGGHVVLHDVSFVVQPREIRVILGGSGCGKSTLLNNILGLECAMGGTLELLGVSLRAGVDPIPQALREKTGVLFQGGALLSSLTVAQNIALPIRLHRRGLSESVIAEMVASRLEKVQLLHAYYKTPGELSGGMRKRAALARAIALDPPLLFCDEPSAGLDPVTSRSLDELLLELRDTLGLAVVIVTHELDSIKAIADRLLFLHQGNVLFDGSLADGKSSDVAEVRDFFARKSPAGVAGAGALNFTFVENP
jgi:phospholipid/cholesterol/gamma-HCH transport system ATP-binding protein